MQHNRLIDVLRTFTPREWKEFDKSMKGKYRSASDAYRLWNYLKNHKNDLHVDLIDTPRLIRKVKISSSKRALNVRSDLLKNLDDYLVLESMEKSFGYEVERLAVYLKKGLYHHADLLKRKMDQSVRNNKKHDLWSGFQQLRAEHLYMYSDNPKNVRGGQEVLIRCHELLTEFTSQLASFYRLEVQNRSNQVKESYNGIAGQMHLLAELKPESNLKKVLHQTFSLLADNDSEAYEYLKEIIMTRHDEFSLEIQQAVLLYLIQYLFRLIKSGERTDKVKEILDFYNHGVEKGILLYNGKITKSRFINVIEVACALGEFVMARNFINTCRPFLDKSTSEDLEIYALANIAFWQKKYNSSYIQQAGQLRFPDIIEEQRLLEILVISDLEINKDDDVEFVESRIQSLERWLRKHREHISTVNLRGGINLVKIMRMFLRNESREKITEEFQSFEHLRRRSWIEQRLKK